MTRTETIEAELAPVDHERLMAALEPYYWDDNHPDDMSNLGVFSMYSALDREQQLAVLASAGKPVIIRTARQAFEHLKDMGELETERLRALYLDGRYEVVHDEVISTGSTTSAIVSPRDVFRPAIAHGAVAVILAHNHPSGSLEPTEADADVTQQLMEGGKLLGVEVLDHLIITGDSYLSMLVDE